MNIVSRLFSRHSRIPDPKRRVIKNPVIVYCEGMCSPMFFKRDVLVTEGGRESIKAICEVRNVYYKEVIKEVRRQTKKEIRYEVEKYDLKIEYQETEPDLCLSKSDCYIIVSGVCVIKRGGLSVYFDSTNPCVRDNEIKLMIDHVSDSAKDLGVPLEVYIEFLKMHSLLDLES